MARDIYNFIWVMPEAGAASSGPAAQQATNTVARQQASTRGVILFPTFMTPLVHVTNHDEEDFELLIATERELTIGMVNRQLKLSLGLHPEKPYDPAPLFPSAAGNIEVESAGSVSDNRTTILESHTKFAGILHPSYATALRNKRLRRVYRVRISNQALPSESSQDERNYTRTERKFTHYYSRDGQARRGFSEALVGKELSDVMIRDMLRNRYGPDSSSNTTPLPGRGRYAFPMRGNSVNLGRVDPNSPIQSYHPLVIYTGDDAKQYLDFGHVSDIHVNTRWQFLGKSPARMIEYGDGINENESPKIGSIVGETNRNFHNVLSRICGAADVMVVGGDLIDHIRNAYNGHRAIDRTPTVREIWSMMDIDDPGYSETSYPVGLDLVAFFSIMVDATSSRSMPFYAITGNHDCYVEPYGISPRLHGKRANEGIPADLNLTYYEAMLAFGPSAGLLRQMASSFDEDWFDWFHHVLTPFNDWWFKFPKQSLVGLGWGDSEDLLLDEQGFGHLPRSEDGVSDGQLALLNKAVDERSERKVTLTSHFTFLSFADNLPVLPYNSSGSMHHATGSMSNGAQLYNDKELGTFESNRGALIDLLDQDKLQVVLTGHSHRRGLYVPSSYAWNTGLTVTMYDTDPHNRYGRSNIPADMRDSEPFVVVSDSAGPYPRHNRHGEFVGWGSDKPGGTLISFGSDGKVHQVKCYNAHGRSKPRLAVAMDYVDVTTDEGIFVDNEMVTDWVSGSVHSGRTTGTYVIKANLRRRVWHDWRIGIAKLIFAGFHNDAWIRVEATFSRAHGGYLVPADQSADFRTWLQVIRTPTRFVSIKLGTYSGDERANAMVTYLRDRYDFDSHWNFEVETETETHRERQSRHTWTTTGYRYKIKRPQRAIEIYGINCDWRESPNFDWRTAHDTKYQ